MKFNINEFKVDEAAKNNGIWVEFGGGASFLIASFGNEDFATHFRKETKPYNDLGREVPEDETMKIIIEGMAKYIVLDWKNVYDDDKEYKYSQKNCIQLLNEIEFIRDKIIEESKKHENYKQVKTEAIEKN